MKYYFTTMETCSDCPFFNEVYDVDIEDCTSSDDADGVCTYRDEFRPIKADWNNEIDPGCTFRNLGELTINHITEKINEALHPKPTINLYDETIKELKEHDISEDEILWVVHTNRKIKTKWDDIKEEFKKINYCGACGGYEISHNIRIVGKGWYLWREEYDGMEWWTFEEDYNYDDDFEENKLHPALISLSAVVDNGD